MWDDVGLTVLLTYAQPADAQGRSPSSEPVRVARSLFGGDTLIKQESEQEPQAPQRPALSAPPNRFGFRSSYRRREETSLKSQPASTVSCHEFCRV